MTTPETSYDRMVAAQIAQYADVDDMHDLPAAAGYYSDRYISPQILDVFGVRGMAEFYGRYVAEAMRRTERKTVVSLGAGYGDLEIEIAKWLVAAGFSDFKIVCQELSPTLLERLAATAKSEGLAKLVLGVQGDVNEVWPSFGYEPVAAFMVNQALHHFVELERIFDQMHDRLHKEGAFITSDMIGRNGHMRWPETLSVVRHIWSFIPVELKRDWSLGGTDLWFNDWDCSTEGFEGIRSQDVLPLMESRFLFERFCAFGGVSDIFIDRRFGPNFDPSSSANRQLLDRIAAIEAKLLREGAIKPTRMLAVVRRRDSVTAPSNVISGEGPRPTAALRLADTKPAQTDLASLAFVSPYPPLAPVPLSSIGPGQRISFRADGNAGTLTRWGWGPPEDFGRWAVGPSSAIEFVADDTIRAFSFLFIAAPRGASRLLSLQIENGERVFVDASGVMEWVLHTPIEAGTRVLIEFRNSRPRRHDVDGGDDRRPLSFGLVWIVPRIAPTSRWQAAQIVVGNFSKRLVHLAHVIVRPALRRTRPRGHLRRRP